MFNKTLKYFLSVWMFLAMSTSLSAEVGPQAEGSNPEAAPLDAKELILEHLKDDYEWHIATYKNKRSASLYPSYCTVKTQEHSFSLLLSLTKTTVVTKVFTSAKPGSTRKSSGDRRKR